MQLAFEEVTAARLRDAVERVASAPEIAARLAAVGAEVRSRGGVVGAADAVERKVGVS
ncbi:MAG: hypothetical protein WBQ44_02775 [Rhodococcus sp. (in: high G+C Gram-positive bacteria)]